MPGLVWTAELRLACPSSPSSTPRKLFPKLRVSQASCYQISLGKNFFLVFGSGEGYSGMVWSWERGMWESQGNWRWAALRQGGVGRGWGRGKLDREIL